MSIRFPRHLLGLPLHPMLVHFPLAFWLILPFADLCALATGPDPWWWIVQGLTAIGVTIGSFAVITGLLDYIHLSETGSNDVRLAARHGVRTSMVWLTMLVKLIVLGFGQAGSFELWSSLVVDLLACALLLQAVYFGTKITYGEYANR